jgi:hypothetical protein
LLERGDARLVGEVVLAGLHDADAERCPQIGDRRAEHQLHRLVVQDLVLAGREFHVAELLAVLRDLRRVRGVERHELAAAAQDGAGHAIDMCVVETDGGKFDVVRRGDLGLRRVGLVDRPRARKSRRGCRLRQRGTRHARKHSRDPRGLQEIATVRSTHR